MLNVDVASQAAHLTLTVSMAAADHVGEAANQANGAGSRAMDDIGGIEGLVTTVLPVMLVIAMFIGLGIWLLGRRLARPACAVSGLVLGSLGGLLLAEMLREQGAFVIPLVIGAGLAGGLLAALLFRVWMAISGAVLLAMVVPAAMVVWQGAPAPDADDEAAPPEARAPDTLPEDAPPGPPTDATAEAMLSWFERLTGIELDSIDDLPAHLDKHDLDPATLEALEASPLRDVATEQIEAALGRGRDRALSWYDQNRERIAHWWESLSPSAKRGLFLGAGIGALLGLTLGLAVPYTAAAVQSALAGSILMYLPLHALIGRHAPEWAGLLPQSPRAVLMWLGLITLLGVMLQWTLFHKRTDR